MPIARHRAAWWGLGVAILILVATAAIPMLTGWDVETRRDDKTEFPPLHGFWDPKVGTGTIPAILIAALAFLQASRAAQMLSWRKLLLVSFLAGCAWMFALALVDGPEGITRVLGNPYEYLITAREEQDRFGAALDEWLERMPKPAEDNWVTHIAGHPPGALLFFIVLVKIGLGGDLAAAVVTILIAATAALAVMTTLRVLGREDIARLLAPFLVFSPMAIFLAVSADAIFAAVAAWGLVCLALGSVAIKRGTTATMLGWSTLAGLLLGYSVMMSYGLPLMGLLALAVLFLGGSWRPLPIAVIAACVVVGIFALNGWAWWEAYPVLVDRYYEGSGGTRPQFYWVWGNLGALLFATGPLVGVGMAMLMTEARDTEASGRLARVTEYARKPELLLPSTAALTLSLATLSGMSKSETERIWLPFMIWLSVCLALLPERWRKPGLAIQLVFALAVQHLLYTSW